MRTVPATSNKLFPKHPILHGLSFAMRIPQHRKRILGRIFLAAGVALVAIGFATKTLVTVRMVPIPELQETDWRGFSREFKLNWPMVTASLLFLCIGVKWSFTKLPDFHND